MAKMLIVNAITLSRVILSGIFIFFIFSPDRRLLSIILSFAAICTTDFIDGKLARKFNACSRYGAVLDVSADFIFIISAQIALALLGQLPVWMAAVTALKFLEFCYTSMLYRQLKDAGESVFLSDPLGRITAIALYLLPVAAILLKYFLPGGIYLPAVNGLCYMISFAALVSAIGRIMMLMRRRRLTGSI
ncbi:MAG TPA: CDP-alcohol phosphatidyltransferase family protein [Anaerovoracaceae bacterium]|nr:CDP-alcohol phosphatidyltransferase family protein [Anaerovoracaceae bacterium]